MNIFDKALKILKEGYEHDQINCALYYFHSFTKSGDQKIYEKNEFQSNKFINIFKPLIDAFIIGESNVLHNIFDFYYIIGKKYNLFNEISNRYMKYLDEIAELCLLFTNKEKGEFYRKIYSPFNQESVEVGSYHSLLFIYLYGLTTKIKKDLFKAEHCLKAAIKFDEHSEPFYTRLLYKIKHKLLKLGAINDFNEVENLKNKVFNLYEKNKYYENYGNSYYYYFGELYEYGFGTAKDEKMAHFYYMEGSKPLHNLLDYFIIVYKRYLSIKKINSKKFNDLNNNKNSKEKFNVIFRLSTGKDINLLINEDMTISEIKNELYKKQDLRRLNIRAFLFNGNQLKDNEKVIKFKIKSNQIVVVMVMNKEEMLSFQ